MDADFDLILPCSEHVVWMRCGELRIGHPSHNEFVDTQDLFGIDPGFGQGIIACGASPEGRILWYYSAVVGGLCEVDWSRPTHPRVLWSGSDELSISAIAAYKDRLFVMLQNLDQMTSSLCEYRDGSLSPVRIDALPAHERLGYATHLRLLGLKSGIAMYEPGAGRLWRWEPDVHLECALVVPANSIIGVGQPFQVWIAEPAGSEMVMSQGKNVSAKRFALRGGSTLSGLVEYREQLWGVDREGSWAALTTPGHDVATRVW